MKPEPRRSVSTQKEHIIDDKDHTVKRKKMSADERMFKNRERNKSHARKTRERKKNFMNALASRITDLEEESAGLRSKVDTRYTANVLLGLGGATTEGTDGEIVRIRSSRSICKELDMLADEKQNDLHIQQKQVEEDQDYLLNRCSAEVLTSAHKRNGSAESVSAATAERRAKGKYTPQERETIRRERNRIHAKKTRDRKKLFLGWSDKRIETLEAEVASLRTYLLSTKALTPREVSSFEDKDKIARFELAHLKETNGSAMDTLLGIKSIASAVDDLGEEDGVKFNNNNDTFTSNSGSGMYSSDSSVSGSPNHGFAAENRSSNSNSRNNSSKNSNDGLDRDMDVDHASRKSLKRGRSTDDMIWNVKHGFILPPASEADKSSSCTTNSVVSKTSDSRTEGERNSSSNNSNNSGDDIDDMGPRRRGWEDGLGSSGGSDTGDEVSGSGSTDGSTSRKSSINEVDKPSLQSLSVKRASVLVN